MINPVSGEGIAYGMTAAARLIENLPAEVADSSALDSALAQFEHDFRRTYQMHIASCKAMYHLMHSVRLTTMVFHAAERDPVVLHDAIEMLFGFGRMRAMSAARILRQCW